jgi:hypothetical protein
MGSVVLSFRRPLHSPVVRRHIHGIGVVPESREILHDLLPDPITWDELCLCQVMSA